MSEISELKESLQDIHNIFELHGKRMSLMDERTKQLQRLLDAQQEVIKSQAELLSLHQKQLNSQFKINEMLMEASKPALLSFFDLFKRKGTK